MKKNVLQITGSFHQGGSERQAVQLTRLLCEDKTHNIFLATLNNEGVLKAEVEKLGFTKIPEFKLTSFYDANFFRQLRKCADFCRQNKIDIVQTHDFYSNVFGIFAARLAKVYLRIAAKRETGGMRSKMQAVVEKTAFRSAHKVVANSLAVKNYLIDQGVSERKIEVIYNGLDLERFEAQITDREKICKELNLPVAEKIKFITLVANLRHTVKNQPMLLRAAQKVTSEFPETHFVLAGEGELRGSLEELTDELKISQNVHFIGRCTKVPEILSISYACVLTSFNEGFSNSILEYMAAGKPVVATNVGGASEAIIENETGFLVESDDDVTLAERLIFLLKNFRKAQKLGQNGRRIVEEKYSLKTQLNKTLELYEVSDFTKQK